MKFLKKIRQIKDNISDDESKANKESEEFLKAYDDKLNSAKNNLLKRLDNDQKIELAYELSLKSYFDYKFDDHEDRDHELI